MMREVTRGTLSKVRLPGGTEMRRICSEMGKGMRLGDLCHMEQKTR